MRLSHWGEARFLPKALFTLEEPDEDNVSRGLRKAEIHQRVSSIGARIQLALLASLSPLHTLLCFTGSSGRRCSKALSILLVLQVAELHSDAGHSGGLIQRSEYLG